MGVPRFSAESGLYRSAGWYRPAASPDSGSTGEVLAQARIGGGGIGGVGGLGFHWPSWCELSCAAAAAACNIGCGVSGPGYFACLVACGAAEVVCLQACNSHGIFID